MKDVSYFFNFRFHEEIIEEVITETTKEIASTSTEEVETIFETADAE